MHSGWYGHRLSSVQFSSVQFSCSVMSDSLRSHGLQHARPPCLSSIHGVYSNSCSLSRLCHPTISSSVVPFSSHLQSFPASGSFQMSQLFTSGGQSIGISASTSVLPMYIYTHKQNQNSPTKVKYNRLTWRTRNQKLCLPEQN